MSCASCGCDLASGAQFCVRCGKRTASSDTQGWVPDWNTTPGAQAAYAPIPREYEQQARVSQNVQALGIAWCFYGAYRFIAVALAASAAQAFGWTSHLGHGVLPFLGFSTMFFSGLSILAGIGLLTRRPWARGLAVFLGVLALFRLPVGTGLGIYTLWALGSRAARTEWRRIQVA